MPADRPSPSVPSVQVVGAALVDDLAAPRLLLAARRTNPPVLAGHWELPGGKVEAGEPPAEALRRELREELGVEIGIGDLVPGPLPTAAWPLTAPYVMTVWLAAIVSGQPAPLEDHDELRWLSAAQLHDVPWLPANAPIVAALRDVLARPRPFDPPPSASGAPPPA